MQAIEFETDLQNGVAIAIPPELLANVPYRARARVIILFAEAAEAAEEQEFRRATYEHFLRDDSDEDSVYDKYAS